MSGKNKKQFGVWMDTQHATITGRENVDSGSFIVIGHVKNNGPGSNSNEKTANNHEKTLTHQFFKEIAHLMQNAEEVHVTGTGDIQEEFIKYLGDSAQFKNTITNESTSLKTSDEKFIEIISARFD